MVASIQTNACCICIINELSSPSYHQTGDGTKPLWCIQPSCRVSRIHLCQIDVLQEIHSSVKLCCMVLYPKQHICFSLLKTRQGNIFFSTMGRARISLPQSNEITKYRTWAVQCMTREYLKKYMWWPHDKERAAKGTSDLVWKINCSRNACTNFSIQVPLYMIQENQSKQDSSISLERDKNIAR